MEPEEEKHTQSRKKQVLEKMKVTSDFGRVFRKLTYLLENIETVVGKNLTATMFWFIVDCLYFSNTDCSFELPQIQNLRQCRTSHLTNGSTIDLELQLEEEFLQKLRRYVSTSKNTLNHHDIRMTPIDQLIQLLEIQETKKKQEIDLALEDVLSKAQQEELNQQTIFQQFGIEKHEAHPMFKYELFQSNLAEKWKQDEENQSTIPKCYICYQPSNLLKCQHCFLQVHRQCYPALNDAKQKENSQQNQFSCENCRLEIDSESQVCLLCSCVGGSFLQTDVRQSPKLIKIYHPTNIQLNSKNVMHLDFTIQKREPNLKKKYIHVSCFLWNSQCSWNPHRKLVEKTQKIEKKKFTGSCSLCGLSRGAAVPCSNDTCRRLYHAQCARRNKLELILIKAKTSSVIELYCGRHRHLKQYEALYESQGTKMREVRKLYEGIDRQLKRLNLSQSFPQIKSIFDKDACNVCMKEEGSQKILVCKQCRRWYHLSCSNQCINCHNSN